MKSRQINFFISNNELPNFNKYLAENGWLIIKAESLQPEPTIIPYIETKDQSDSNKIFLVPAKSLAQVKFTFVEKRNCYVVDEFSNSPVIELLRPYYDEEKNTLGRGRLYYIKADYNEQKELISKSDEFLAAAEKLFRGFRKIFKNVKSAEFKSYLISKNTAKLIEETGLVLKAV